MTDTQPLTIHQALLGAIASLGGVDKDAENKDQHFKFRSIEGIVAAAKNVLIEFGITVVPTYRNIEQTDYLSSGGSPTHRSIIEGTYAFTGPAGDSIEVVTIGEAVDTQGRSTNKAMSAAFKYALVQALQIASGDDGDLQDIPVPRHQNYSSGPAAATNVQRETPQVAPTGLKAVLAPTTGPPAIQAAETKNSGELCSKAQSGKVWATLEKNLGWDKTRALQEVELITGRQVGDYSELTKSEAKAVIDAGLERLEAPQEAPADYQQEIEAF